MVKNRFMLLTLLCILCVLTCVAVVKIKSNRVQENVDKLESYTAPQSEQDATVEEIIHNDNVDLVTVEDSPLSSVSKDDIPYDIQSLDLYNRYFSEPKYRLFVDSDSLRYVCNGDSVKVYFTGLSDYGYSKNDITVIEYKDGLYLEVEDILDFEAFLDAKYDSYLSEHVPSNYSNADSGITYDGYSLVTFNSFGDDESLSYISEFDAYSRYGNDFVQAVNKVFGDLSYAYVATSYIDSYLTTLDNNKYEVSNVYESSEAVTFDVTGIRYGNVVTLRVYLNRKGVDIFIPTT